ncbi:MAG: reverse transcriptase family protein [Verrucomicrobiota bacterium]
MSDWTPHSFKAAATAKGVAPDALQKLIEEGERLRLKGVPVVFTLGHLAAICNVPYKYLRDIVSRKFDPYKVFNIRKRSGGYRQITVPEVTLMRVQTWIHENILAVAKVSPISTAYSEGSSPFKNAEQHSRCRWLVKVDVKSFFESISERQVYKVFRSIGYPPLLSFELTRLCTRFPGGESKRDQRRWRSNSRPYAIQPYMTQVVGHLPQGAPTSPMLANLVCAELDSRLAELATKHGGVITRYADDIVFSAMDFDRTRAKSLVKEITAALTSLGLRRNETKTHVVPPSARRVVTGLLVDSGAPRLTKAFRDKLRMHLFHARTKGIRVHCERRKFRSLIGFREHVRGLIAYAAQVDEQFAAERRAEFEALPWGILGI